VVLIKWSDFGVRLLIERSKVAASVLLLMKLPAPASASLSISHIAPLPWQAERTLKMASPSPVLRELRMAITFVKYPNVGWCKAGVSLLINKSKAEVMVCLLPSQYPLLLRFLVFKHMQI